MHQAALVSLCARLAAVLAPVVSPYGDRLEVWHNGYAVLVTPGGGWAVGADGSVGLAGDWPVTRAQLLRRGVSALITAGYAARVRVEPEGPCWIEIPIE